MYSSHFLPVHFLNDYKFTFHSYYSISYPFFLQVFCFYGIFALIIALFFLSWYTENSIVQEGLDEIF